MYVVLSAFVDAQDKDHIYYTGDVYPRPGIKVSKERLEELSSNRNRCGMPMIVREDPKEGLSEAKGGADGTADGSAPVEHSEGQKKARERARRK